MKYITAEGPSTEFSYLTRNGKLDVFIPRPTGHTYPAAHEPVRFVPQETPTKAQVKLLCDIRALPFEPIANGVQLLKLIMDYDKAKQTGSDTAHSLLERAQRVLELYAKTGSASPLPARSVLAAIRAMKAQESK